MPEPAAPPALPAPSSRGSGTPPTSFVPAPTFAGPRPGFVYKSGPRGVGYYAEGTLLAPGAQPQSAPKPFAVKPSFSAIAAEEEEDDDGEPETQTTSEAAAAVARDASEREALTQKHLAARRAFERDVRRRATKTGVDLKTEFYAAFTAALEQTRSASARCFR